MPSAEFGPTGPAVERVLVPDTPTRVFYRTRRKSGLTSKLNRGIFTMKNTIKTRLAALSTVLAASIGSAYAAVPTEVSDAITAAQDDSKTVAVGFLVAIIAIAAINIMRKGAH